MRWLLIFLLILAAVTAARLTPRPLWRGAASSRPPTPHHLLARIEPLAELATVRVEVAGIVALRGDRPLLVLPRPGIVLIARGSALIAVDLAGAEIELTTSGVVITLPQPRVLDAWVDVERSEVWERRGRSSGLEARAWREAAAMVRVNAAAAPHLDLARERAERLVTDALAGLTPGREVIVTWRA